MPRALAVFLASVGTFTVGLLLRNEPLLILSIGLLLTSCGMGLMGSSKGRSEDRAILPQNEVLLARLRKLRAEIATLIDEEKDSPTVQAFGPESLAEADRILSQAARAVEARGKIAKAAFGRADAEAAVARLEQQIAESPPETREALGVALEARRSEVQTYRSIEAKVAAIDARIQEAEAAVAVLRARLAGGIGDERAASSGVEEMRDALGRVKALSLSVEETRSVFGGPPGA